MAYESDDPIPAPRPATAATATRGLRSEMRSEGPAIRHSGRAGDDDPSPSAPPEEAWRRIVEARAKRQAEKAPAGAPAEGRVGPMPEASADGRVGRFVVYSAVALVVLLVCNLLYGPIRNVLQAQTRAELAFACALLAVTVGVFASVAWRAWSLFAGHPKVTAIRERDYRDRPTELARRIEEDYVRLLQAHRDRYGAELRLRDDDALMMALDRLKKRDHADSRRRVAAFKEFQGLQDGLAAEIVRRYALRIAAKTAISPWRIVDMLAVAYNSTVMICLIARVYDRRVSRAQAFRLLLTWAFNLYVSGELGDVVKSSAEGLGDGLDGLFGENGFSTILQPVLPLFAKVVGKAAEGGINAYNAYRFGRKAIAAFRYLQ